MLTRSTKWCASRPNAPTTSPSSMNSPARRGGPSASLSRIPNSARRVDHRPIGVRGEDMRVGNAAAPFREVADAALVARKPLKERLPCRESDCFGLGDRMNRRAFMLLAAATAIDRNPAAAEAKMPRIGFIQAGFRQDNQGLLDWFG